MWRAAGFRNYASYDEHQAAAEKLLKEELQKGYLQWGPSRARLEHEHGPLVLSRIAVLVKLRGSRLKYRLIHDLRRSGVNQRARIPERGVLPRLRDAIDSLLHVARGAPAEGQARILVLDSTDAFKQV